MAIYSAYAWDSMKAKYAFSLDGRTGQSCGGIERILTVLKSIRLVMDGHWCCSHCWFHTGLHFQLTSWKSRFCLYLLAPC